MNYKRVAFIVAVSALSLSGCSSSRYEIVQDSAPTTLNQIEATSVPDAIPKVEPLSRTGNAPYRVFGVRYTPLAGSNGYVEEGVASWYGQKFHGKKTSSGEIYDMYQMTAAHRTLPLPTYARVDNLTNGRSIVVKINDRGPFVNNRVIDLSYVAATKLGIADAGVGNVRVTALDPTRVYASNPSSTTRAYGSTGGPVVPEVLDITTLPGTTSSVYGEQGAYVENAPLPPLNTSSTTTPPTGGSWSTEAPPAPTATTSSGFTPLCGARSKNSATAA